MAPSSIELKLDLCQILVFLKDCLGVEGKNDRRVLAKVKPSRLLSLHGPIF